MWKIHQLEQPQPEFAFYFIFPFFTTVALADKHAEKGQLMRNAKTPETANDGGETTGRCAAGCFLKRKLDPEGYFFPPSQRVISVYFSDIIYQQTESRARGVREFYRRRRRKKKGESYPLTMWGWWPQKSTTCGRDNNTKHKKDLHFGGLETLQIKDFSFILFSFFLLEGQVAPINLRFVFFPVWRIRINQSTS